MTLTPDPRTLEFALKYAALGWPVRPGFHLSENNVCSCGWPPEYCTTPGKHPHVMDGPKGSKRPAVPYSTDPNVVRDYFARWPFATVWVKTGTEADLSALDVDVHDPKANGYERLRELEVQHGAMPHGPGDETPSGGSHRLLRYRGPGFGSESISLGGGLEVLYGKGLIVPPSLGRGGKRYEFPAGAEPWAVELPEAPEWLIAETMAKAKKREQGGARGPTLGAEDNVILPSDRHPKLTTLAASLAAKGMKPDERYDALQGVNQRRCRPPKPDAEIRRLADWEPKDDPLRSFTDLGNAEAFVDHHSGQVLFVPRVGWFVWDGSRWKRDDDGAVHRYAEATVRILRDRAGDIADKTVQAALEKHARASESNPRLEALVSRAEKQAVLLESVDRLDADPYKIGAPNGTICLKTALLLPADPADRITRCVAVEYEPGARSDLWETFLASQVPDDEVRLYVQKAEGAALISPKQERLWFFNGPGGSGKGTHLSASQSVLGEYAATTDPAVFSEKGSHEVQLEMARLLGKRIVILPELDRNIRLAMRLLKQISGRDRVRAREHHRQAFDYAPTFSFFFSTNYIPKTDSFDPSTDRRIVVIPFPNAIPLDQQDPSIKERLCTYPEHMKAVLAWIVAGARLYVEDGERLTIPKASREAGKRWKDANDPLAAFLESYCKRDPAAWESRGKLEVALRKWEQEEERDPAPWKDFATYLREKDCTDKRRRLEPGANPVAGFLGIRLLTDDESNKKEADDLFAEEARHAAD